MNKIKLDRQTKLYDGYNSNQTGKLTDYLWTSKRKQKEQEKRQIL